MPPDGMWMGNTDSFFDARGEVYGVNGKATKQAFDDSYSTDILPGRAREAVHTDLEGK